MGDWISVDTDPEPLKGGVLCDRFYVQLLYGACDLCYYFYRDKQWTQGHGDTQKILYWLRLPEPPKEIEEEDNA